MDSAVLDNAWAWRAKIDSCGKFRSKDRRLDQVIETKGGPGKDVELIPATSANIRDFIDRAVAKIPNAAKRENAAAGLHERLDVNPVNDDTATLTKAWIDCEAKADNISDETFDKNRAVVLRNLVCESWNKPKDREDDDALEAWENRAAITAGIIHRWVIPFSDHGPTILSIALARGLLGQDGEACAAAKHFDRTTMSGLRVAAAKTVPTPAPPK